VRDVTYSRPARRVLLPFCTPDHLRRRPGERRAIRAGVPREEAAEL